MLNNLRAELTRKGLKPEKAIEAVLGCTYKTAKSKLDGVTDFTVPEAIQVMQAYFAQENFEFEYLFATQDQESA